MRFQLIRNRRTKQWRWKLLAANGKSIAISGESYKRPSDCLRAINLVRMGTDARTPIEGGEPRVA